MPAFVDRLGVKLVIAGGMGQKALKQFEEKGIAVVCGAQGGSPLEVVSTYMEGKLLVSANACDH
jgi:predicted Fe-Mo cluster-binding NifX family protein